MSKVYIIADCAGRMTELGKDHIQDYLLRTVRSLLCDGRYDDAEPVFLAWSGDIVSLDEALEMKFGGKSDVERMAKTLEGMEPGTPVLFLSDGNFRNTQGTLGRGWELIYNAAKTSGVKIVGVIVGTDADVTTMNEVSTVFEAFPAENITAAVSLLCSYLG